MKTMDGRTSIGSRLSGSQQGGKINESDRSIQNMEAAPRLPVQLCKNHQWQACLPQMRRYGHNDLSVGSRAVRHCDGVCHKHYNEVMREGM